MYLVLVANLSRDMMRFLRVFIEQDIGIDWLTVNVVTALDDEQPKGAGKKYNAEQVARAGRALRARLSAIPRDAVVVPMGPEVTRIVTGRYGKGNTLEDIRGYMLPHWELRPRPGKERQQIGAYKTNNAKRGYKIGDPKFGLASIQVPPPMGADFHGTVVPTYAPEYIQDMGRKPIFAWLQDLKRAKDLPYPQDAPFNISEIFGRGDRVPRQFDGFPRFNSPQDLASIQSRWKVDTGFPEAGPVIAFDIETVGHSDSIDRLGLSNGHSTISLPWNNATREIARQLLGNPGPLKIAHNITFDVPRLEKAGVEVVGPIWDTMIAHQVLQPDLPKGLGRVASLYCDLAVPWKAESERNPEAYNAKDTWILPHIQQEQQGFLEETGMLQLFRDMMETVPTLMEMERAGMKVDRVERNKWALQLTEQLETACAQMAGLYPGVDPASPRQVAKLLYDRLGLPKHWNRDDGLTADAAALHDLKRTNPEHTALFEILLSARDAATNLGRYTDMVLDEQSKVHPKFLPQQKDDRDERGNKRKGAASTRRLGVSDPPIQQQPKVARVMYIPDSPEDVLMSADWNQAELRVIAYRSGDERLKEALEGDVHAHTMELMGLTGERARTIAKVTTYLTCYGGGPRKLRESFQEEGIEKSEADCKAYINGWSLAYPLAWAYLQNLGTRGKLEGYLVDPFGYRRYFYGGGRDIPEMKDFIPQATVAGMMWIVLRPIQEAMVPLGGRLMANIHDEFLVQVPRAQVPESQSRLRSILEQEFPQVCPGFRVPVSVKVGNNWRDMKLCELA